MRAGCRCSRGGEPATILTEVTGCQRDALSVDARRRRRLFSAGIFAGMLRL